jgi:molybdenum cofactor cytidylyltransferase
MQMHTRRRLAQRSWAPALALDKTYDSPMTDPRVTSMEAPAEHGPVVLILASGRGERFRASGGTTHKLQALLGDRTVLEHTLAAVRESGLRWHLEAVGHPGMGDSIAAAVRATGDVPGWLILPGDLPLVSGATLRRVAQALQSHPVVQPAYAGRRGHPVGFASVCGPGLRALSGPQGAASVLRAHPAFVLNVDDIGCVTDIDTVADLEAARLLLHRRT